MTNELFIYYPVFPNVFLILDHLVYKYFQFNIKNSLRAKTR